jgi:chromosome segregation ATPase
MSSADTERQLAGLIMDADLPKRLQAEIAAKETQHANVLRENEFQRQEIEALRKRLGELEALRIHLEADNREAALDCRGLRKRVAELEVQNADLRRWKALDKPLTAAMAIANISTQEHRARAEQAEAQLAEAQHSRQMQREAFESELRTNSKLTAQLAEAHERCKAAEELVLTPAGNIYAKLAEAKAERDAMREALESLVGVARVKMKDAPFALVKAQKLLAPAGREG